MAYVAPPDHDIAAPGLVVAGDHEPASFLLVDDPPHRHGFGRLAVPSALATQILKVALPVVLGMLTQTAINILDTLMVGRLPENLANEAQAAIGWSLPLMWMVGGFLSAIWVGTQAITSRRAGEGDDALAGRALSNSIVVALASSVVLSCVAYLAVPLLVQRMYHEYPSTAALASQYLQIRLVGVPAMVLTFSYKSFFDGTGRTRIFMVAAVVMNLLNVVLNYVLIYGFAPLDIPQMAAPGAAVASAVAAYVGLAVLVGWSLRPSLDRRYGYYRVSKLSVAVMREIVRLSIPNALATVIVMVGFAAFYWVVSQVAVVAHNPLVNTANQVIITTAMVSFMSALAFGMATAAIVSQSLGARRPCLAESYGWNAAKLWAYVIAAFGLVLIIWPDAILAVVNPAESVIALARRPTQLIAAIQGLMAFAIILAQTLYGVGNAKYVMYVELVLHLLVLAPSAYLFGVVLDGGLIGVYFGPTLYVALLGGAMVWKFARGEWKHIVI